MDTKESGDYSGSNLSSVRRLRLAVAMAIIRTARREGSIETGYQVALRMYTAQTRKQQNTVELYERIISENCSRGGSRDVGEDYAASAPFESRTPLVPLKRSRTNFDPASVRDNTTTTQVRNTMFQFHPPSRQLDIESAVLHIRTLLNYGIIQTHNSSKKRIINQTTERSITLLYTYLNKYTIKFSDNYEILIQFSNLLISSFCESSFKFEDDHQLVTEVEYLLNMNICDISNICYLITLIDHIYDNVTILKNFAWFSDKHAIPLFEIEIISNLIHFIESTLNSFSTITLRNTSGNLNAALDKLISKFQSICNDLQLHLNGCLPLIVIQMNSHLHSLQQIIKATS